MANDATLPRTRIIGLLMLATVVTLGALEFILEQYFAVETEKAERRAIEASPARRPSEIRERDRQWLEQGPLTIMQAKAQLAGTDRARLSAIAPQPSTDQGPLRGWMQLPEPQDSLVHALVGQKP